jgi:hypothetical protein
VFYTQENSKWKIVLILSAHNLNQKNFWTGEWLSLWEIENVNENSFQVKGNVKANTYYYEEGNIQFNLNKEFLENLNSTTSEEGLAKEIIEFIENVENNVNNFFNSRFKLILTKYMIIFQIIISNH